MRKVLQEEFEKEQCAEKKMLEDRLAEKDQRPREASEKELELPQRKK